jgi:hypothetical protein
MNMDSITSGDVQLSITGVFAVALSVWATLVGGALIFRRKASQAHTYFEKSPWLTLLLGVIVGGPCTLVAFVLMQAHMPIVTILAFGMLSVIVGVCTVGGAGFALLAGSRIESMGSGPSFAALVKGAGLVVLIGMVPFFGILAYVPLLLLCSFGAGLQAMVHRPVSAYTPEGYASAASEVIR